MFDDSAQSAVKKYLSCGIEERNPLPTLGVCVGGSSEGLKKESWSPEKPPLSNHLYPLVLMPTAMEGQPLCLGD